MDVRPWSALLVGLAAWSCLFALRAQGGELAYGGGYSYARDSNITHDPFSPTPEQTHVAFAGLAYREKTDNLEARILAQIEARTFKNETFSNDTAPYLEALAVWAILPKRFIWTLEDVYRETIVDLAAPDTPNNQTRTNSLNTGPDFVLQVDAANSFDIGLRYGRYDVEGPGDNERVTGRISYLRRLGAQSTLSLNYEGTGIKFAPPSLYEHVQRDDLYLRYRAFASPADNLQAEIGATRLTPKRGEPQDGHRVRFRYARRLTSDSSFRLAFADVLTDTFSDLLLSQSADLEVPVSSGDVYRSQSADLAYELKGPRFNIGPSAFARRINYETLPEDYDEQGARIGAGWQISVDLRLDVYASYLQREFRSFVRTDIERDSKLSITYLMTRTFSATLEGERTQTDSTDPFASYVNNRWMLLLGYSTGPLFVPRSKR